ncbi:MAG: diguanylate cyclase [Gallionella sp.]|nr:diguanylate cyclase [Gallionella sp.]
MLQSNSKILIKLFLQLFFPLALLLSGAAVFFASNSIQNEIAQLHHQQESNAKLGAGTLSDKIEFIAKDLMFLSGHSALLSAIEQPTPEHLAHLARDFANFSNSKKDYDQIRWIDESGMEMVRVDFLNGKPVSVPSSKLQNKSARYYFTDTIKLNPGEIFVSPLDLNIEQDKIEIPYKPMIRIATPVTDAAGRKRGIVILNYYGSKLLQAYAKATADIAASRMLVNREGFWLMSPTPSDEWGFMFDRPEQTLAVRAPAAWKRIRANDSGQVMLDDGIWVWETVYPLLSNQKTTTGTGKAFSPSHSELEYRQYFWKSIAHYSAAQLDALRQVIWQRTAWILGLLLAFSGAACWILARSWHLLAEANVSYRAVADYTHNWETWIDPAGNYVYCSPSCQRITGRSAEEFISDPDLLVRITHPQDRQQMKDHLHQLEQVGYEPAELVVRITLPDGQTRWLEHSCQAVFDTTGKYLGRRASNRDISERIQAEARMRESEERLVEAQRISHLGNWALDHISGELFWSEQIFRLFEIDSHDFRPTYEGFLNNVHPEDRESVNSTYTHSLKTQKPYEIIHRLLMQDGRIKWVSERCQTAFDAQGAPIRSVGTVQDITEQQTAQQRIEHMAHYDTLTGLPNRALFYDRLRQALVLAKRHEVGLALLYMDLDGFKKVNDTQGHHAGDLVLKIAAERMFACVRESDTVSRLGGDEFTIILNDAHNQEDVAAIAQKILNAISAPFDIDGNNVHIGISIGIAHYSENAGNEDELVSQADHAMYMAKMAGKNTYHIGVYDQHSAYSDHQGSEHS